MHEHSGKNPRTGKMMSGPSHSSILDQSINCNTKIDISRFKILNQISCKFSLRILGSFYINKEKPKLNDIYLLLDNFFIFVLCIDIYPV